MIIISLTVQRASAQKRSPAEVYADYSSAVVSIETPEGSGSGFIISDDGIVVTNYHVVESHARVTVKVNGRRMTGKVSRIQPRNDIALLNIVPASYNSVVLGSSDDLAIGEDIIAIGNPLGFEASLSIGIVSGRRMLAGKGDLIQITAPISPGSSGGPLFDTMGRVVGITTATYAGGQNLNFAVPIERVLEMINQDKAATEAETSTAPETRSVSHYVLGMETPIEDTWIARTVTGWQIIELYTCNINSLIVKQELTKAERLFRQAIEMHPSVNMGDQVTVQGYRIPGRSYSLHGKRYSLGGRHNPYWGLLLVQACRVDLDNAIDTIRSVKAAGLLHVNDAGYFVSNDDHRASYWDGIKRSMRLQRAIRSLWGGNAVAFASR